MGMITAKEAAAVARALGHADALEEQRLARLAGAVRPDDLRSRTGIELEFSAVGPQLFADHGGRMLYPAGTDGKAIVPAMPGGLAYMPVAETFQFVAETVSRPLELDEVDAALAQMYNGTAAVAAGSGLGVLAHSLQVLPPIGGYEVTDAERYQRSLNVMGRPYSHVVTTGLHVHGTAGIGAVQDDADGTAPLDLRVEVMRRESVFESLFIGLSAGSPIKDGTLVARGRIRSERQSLIFGKPVQVSMPPLRSWQEYVDFGFRVLSTLGLPANRLSHLTRLQPSTRASVRHPTTEMRVFDLGLTKDYNKFLVYAFHGLHRQVLADIEAGLRPTAWLPDDAAGIAVRQAGDKVASRDGIDAVLPNPFEGGAANRPLREIFSAFMDYVRPSFTESQWEEFSWLASHVVGFQGRGDTATRVLRLLAEAEREVAEERWSDPFRGFRVADLCPTDVNMAADTSLAIPVAQRLVAKMMATNQVGTIDGNDDLVRVTTAEIVGRQREAARTLKSKDVRSLLSLRGVERSQRAFELGIVAAPAAGCAAGEAVDLTAPFPPLSGSTVIG